MLASGVCTHPPTHARMHTMISVLLPPISDAEPESDTSLAIELYRSMLLPQDYWAPDSIPLDSSRSLSRKTVPDF